VQFDLMAGIEGEPGRSYGSSMSKRVRDFILWGTIAVMLILLSTLFRYPHA